jgi:hypothetical protein
MAQFQQQWTGGGETAWLSALVETLQRLSDAQERARPCDPAVVMAARAHLARPACFHGFYGSHFSLRN